MSTALAGLANSPAQYPQTIDLASDAVMFITMNEAGYRAASFLDDRILSPRAQRQWVPYSEVAEAMSAPESRRPLHFIFHSGHVGSTLLSRMLDETGKVLSLREPVPLRTFCDAYDAGASGIDSRLETFLRLWERGFAATEVVVLKATSSAARLAPRLMAMRADAKAVYLNLPAEPYLATLLAGPNSSADLKWHGPERLRRLQTLTGEIPTTLSSLSHGELAALSWLAERLTQQLVTHQLGMRVLALDFDDLLRKPAQTMGNVARHLGVAVTSDYLAGIGRSPVLARYSKAPEYAYSAELRAQLLAEARRDHAQELRKGLRFLEALGALNADVAKVLLV